MQIAEPLKYSHLLLSDSTVSAKRSLSINVRLAMSELSYFLYEINGWLGGPGKRVLLIRSLAGYQPSFDAIWKHILNVNDLNALSGQFLEFEAFDYQIMDQIAESKAQVCETQLLLGCLALSVAGDCNCVLFGQNSTKLLEISEGNVYLECRDESDHFAVIEMCKKYNLPYHE